MKRFIVTFLLPACAFLLLANIAQPGLRNAGGNGRFTPVFSEDSAAFQQIQMVREQVCVQVYRGFAVVKGTYWLWNTAERPVQLKVGYPLNARENPSGNRLIIDFWQDSLTRFKVKLDGRLQGEIREYPEAEIGRWYVWDMAFTPRDTALVEVFFMVNTSWASVTRGYDRKNPNGFVYLLETGATWQQPIREGWIGLQLMDGLDFSDVDGLWPDSVFAVNKMHKTIVRAFRDLSPTPEDNIILTYGKSLDNFDFEAVVRNADALYAAIEAFSKSSPESWELTPRHFDNPFEVGGVSWVGAVLVAIVVAPALVVAGVIILLVRWARRRRRAKSNVDPLR